MLPPFRLPSLCGQRLKHLIKVRLGGQAHQLKEEFEPIGADQVLAGHGTEEVPLLATEVAPLPLQA